MCVTASVLPKRIRFYVSMAATSSGLVAFRWLRTAHGHLSRPAIIGDSTILFGWHDAYEQSENRFQVARAIVITDEYVAVVDILSSFEGSPRLDLTLPLGPGYISAMGSPPKTSNSHSLK
jgi:hypothetical protein